jgi:hypothetical protein
MHPPLPSSSNSSTDRMTRPYSSVRQGRASGRAPTWSACIACNQGSASVESSPRENAPAISGGGALIAGRRARARRARFEWGVGAARAGATRLRRGVDVVDAVPLRFLDGVRGKSESVELGSKTSARSDGSLADSSLYSPSLPAPESVWVSSSTRADVVLVRCFWRGSTATAHGAPEPHSIPSSLARSRERFLCACQSSSKYRPRRAFGFFLGWTQRHSGRGWQTRRRSRLNRGLDRFHSSANCHS